MYDVNKYRCKWKVPEAYFLEMEHKTSSGAWSFTLSIHLRKVFIEGSKMTSLKSDVD